MIMKFQKHIIKSLLVPAAALCVLMTASCQKEREQFRFTAGEEVHFTIGSGGAATKAAYSGVKNSDKTIERIDWEVDDTLRIYCDAVSEPSTKWADYVVTDVTPDGASSTARINGTGGVGLRWGTGDHTFYAVYPSPEAGSVATAVSISPYKPVELKSSASKSISGAAVTAKLPAVQKVVGDITTSATDATLKIAAPDLKNMLMTAKSAVYNPETGIEDGEVFLAFTPLTTAVQFTITNQTGAALILSSVSLTSAASALNGKFEVDIDNASTPAAIDLDGDGNTTGTNDIRYSRAYPECTYTGSVSDATRTVTINFASPVTLAYNADPAQSGKLTFTFFLQPCQNFDDLTFKLVKSDNSWMSTRLGYTDGSGIFFPRFKKTSVTGVFVPEGAQWTVNYGSAGSDDSDAVTLLTSWDMGETGDLNFGDEEPETDFLPGKFSVSPTKYVQFSRGNLRYTIATGEWSFFDQQYDCGPATYVDGHDREISLFTWGYSKTQSIVPDGVATDNVSRASGDLSLSEDWGYVFGGNSSPWSTLTTAEWQYLFNYGSYISDVREGKYKYNVTVCGKANCVVLLPDNWVWGEKGVGNDWQSEYPESGDGVTWAKMEAAGAVCLPAAGFRGIGGIGSYVGYVGNDGSGNYWSSSAYSSADAYSINFDANVGVLVNQNYTRGYGFSVRLVQKFFKPHNAVKIGNVYWATTNIGANTPTDMGWYFYWAGKTGYVHDGSKWVAAQDGSELAGAFYLESTPYHTGSDDKKNWTKYVPTDKSEYWTGTGDPDNKTVLDPEDDAARANWGGFWRMPTSAEFQAMMNATYWAWDSTDNGYYVYTPNPATDAGKMNSSGAGTYNKSNALLFFPATGCGMAAGHSYAGTTGYYWSSTLKLSDPSYAFYLQFTSANLTQGGGRRSYGLSVRPVHD